MNEPTTTSRTLDFPTTKVLDHGYVTFIEHWGSDERIIEAARMSTAKGFLCWGPDADGKPGDEKLLAYLYENRHLTPFEQAGMTIEVQAPIFVFREWHRHRTQSYNEMSARYTPIPALDYLPTVDRCMMNAKASTTNKQAQGSGVALSGDDAMAWLADLEGVYEHAERVYQRGLAIGIPREVARCSMSVARYSRMRASANLRNWLAFLTLRDDKHAQWEIRQFARVVDSLVASIFTRTHALYMKGRAR